MKKQLKKAVAIVSALAMVVAGITVTPNYVGAETTGVEAPAEQLKEIGGDAAATWFYDEAKTTGIKEVVNIQKPGFAKESGVYVSVPAGISKVTVNGNDDAALTAIDGAGVVVYLTSLTKEYNTVVITYANGEGTVVIKNVNGTKDTTDVTQPDASSADVSQPDASSADVTSPDASSADVTSADVTSADVTSADVTSADVTSAVSTSTDVTTTPKATTAKPTTAKPKATTKKASLKQTKVTKKVTKKLSSKKVKLTFKKVKGAKKYTVQVSTSKKFKKVLYKKTVKKTKVTLSSKKLKNKKKLYVRVKAVGAKKWSKVVKIKVKK